MHAQAATRPSHPHHQATPPPASYSTPPDRTACHKHRIRCKYSLRDSNIWRKQQGIPPVKIGGEEAGLGSRYFEDAEADAKEESVEVVESFFASAERGFNSRQVYEGRKRQTGSGAKDGEGKEVNNW